MHNALLFLTVSTESNNVDYEPEKFGTKSGFPEKKTKYSKITAL